MNADEQAVVHDVVLVQEVCIPIQLFSNAGGNGAA